MAVVRGTAGKDRLTGTAFADRIELLAGDDLGYGRDGNDLIRGGEGRDRLIGGAGNDRLDGDDGDDRLDGGDDDDVLRGLGGDDRLDGGAGDDLLEGSAGSDRLLGGEDRDTLNGGGGDDRLFGGLGDDLLTGRRGNDRLDGGAGVDTADYRGRYADYEITTAGSVTTVRDLNPADGDDGTDRLVDVELLQFGDRILNSAGAPAVAKPPTSFGNLGANGFTIVGTATGGRAGEAVGMAGDVDGDGLADLVVGAPGDWIGAAGDGYLLFGRDGRPRADFELADLGSRDGFTVHGRGEGAQSGSAVSAAGDINGDGLDDFVIGQPGGLYGDICEAYVIFGRIGGARPDLDLATFTSVDGFRVTGLPDGEFGGMATAAAGDVNGDGFDDLILGAPEVHAYPYAHDPGQAYVIFGKAGGARADVKVDVLDPAEGFRIEGAVAGDMAGWAVDGAGDVNGDGLADLVVGAPLPMFGMADYDGNPDAGKAYVLFGSPGATRADIRLGELDPSEGFTLSGAVGGDRAGFSVAGAGDVNGDGFADVVVAAPGADASYVIFGRAGSTHDDIDLGNLKAKDGFAIHGWSRSVSAAGDINGDGVDDLIIGQPAEGYSRDEAGASYVVFGRIGGSRADIDLADLDPDDGFRIEGVERFDEAGLAVSGGGDIDGDGFDDVIVGAPEASGTEHAGETYVVFGGNFTGAVTRLGTAASEMIVGSDGRDVVLGAQGDDRLLGLGGDDVLKGGAGNDVIRGGLGNDLLEGDRGADRFVLAPGEGDDIVRDFENGRDTIDLRAFAGLGFDDLVISSGQTSGGPGTLVTIDASMSVRLLEVPQGHIDASDFLFGA